MKLDLKKNLAAKTLSVGKDRVQFDNARLDEIKEAITRQDIRDLVTSGAISVKQPKGRKKVEKRKHRRRIGKIKKKVKTKKKEYISITRKLRKYVTGLKRQGNIDKEKHKELRKGIKNRSFRSKRHLKENLE